MNPDKQWTNYAQIRIKFALDKCTLGVILVAASEIGICAISLDDDPNRLIQAFFRDFPKSEPAGIDGESEPKLIESIAKIVGFIETPTLELNLPLDMRGSVFQQAVWQALRQIPIGMTVSYTEVAQKLGTPKAVRAVARACAANKLALAIPCHRVVRADGTLSGYRWGIERKAELLRRERESSILSALTSISA